MLVGLFFLPKGFSMTIATENKLTRLTAKALEYAKKTGEAYCVCSVEQGEKLCVQVWREADTWGDEFEAFDGRVLMVCYEDGETE